MKSFRVTLKSNPRHLSKYFACGNIVIILYLVILMNLNLMKKINDDLQNPTSNSQESSSSQSIIDLSSSSNLLSEGKNEEKQVGKSKKYKFQDFDIDKWNETQKYFLLNSTYSSQFFVSVGNKECYKHGTDLESSESRDVCVCKPHFHGPQCGIPSSAWNSHFKWNKKAREKLKPRKVPRRLIHGLQVNHEIDLFEARMEMLKEVVDVYLVLESNYSSYGTGKPLTFLDKFKDGWLPEFQDKLMYVFLPFFPKAGETDGWYADSYLRLYLGTRGMPMLENVHDDDVFLLLDADELPTVETLMFLKMYDGWSEPVKFGFRWTVYGFFWLESEEPGMLETIPIFSKIFKPEKKEKLLTLYVVCTVGMLREVYGNNAMALRKNVFAHEKIKNRLYNYTRHQPMPQEWTLGGIGDYAGWHCSWCYPPPGIKHKLQSAQRHDKPRWGDYPEKLDLDYIANLIETGGWFDGKHPLIKVDKRKTPDRIYAPNYFLDNEDKFEYLLVPPRDRV